MLTGCEKDDDPTSVSLRSITREKFDYKGGLASAIVDAGGRDVTAESSESWCRTAVIGSIVNFNVLAYTGSEERSATVTVKAEGLKPLLINVVQDKFRGLVVVPSTLIFSDTDRTLSVAVTCSGVYDVKLTENPNNAFSFSKSEDGASVSFTSNKASSRVEVKGRAEFTPEEGDPVIVTLIQPKKSTYDFLLGTWNVTKTDIFAGASRISRRSHSPPRKINIRTRSPSTIRTQGLSLYGGVRRWQSGHSDRSGTGFSGTKFYTLHFNGPNNGQGNYIWSQAGVVAWAAEPVFDENAGTIQLVFSDNGQGNGRGGQDALFLGEQRPVLVVYRAALFNQRTGTFQKLLTDSECSGRAATFADRGPACAPEPRISMTDQ